jgi:hypothetical protein
MDPKQPKEPNPCGGRPTKFTRDLADKICDSVRMGNFKETASVAAGVDPRTMRNWVLRGARGEEPFASFVGQLEAAEARSEEKDVLRIGLAGKDDWKALAWRLERKSPKKWGFRVRVEVREELEAFLDRLSHQLPPDVYEQVLSAATDDAGAATLGSLTVGEGDATEH